MIQVCVVFVHLCVMTRVALNQLYCWGAFSDGFTHVNLVHSYFDYHACYIIIMTVEFLNFHVGG